MNGLFFDTDSLEETFLHDATGHFVEHVPIGRLRQEAQRDLKAALIFDVPASVVRLSVFIKAKKLFQKRIRVHGIAPCPERAINRLAVHNAKNKDRVCSLSLEQKFRYLWDAIAVFAPYLSLIHI